MLFTGVVSVPAAAQHDTLQFRYNATHTGDYSPVAGPVASNGLLKWTFTTGSLVESSPAVANGVVYVGSYDYKVYAIGNQPRALCTHHAHCHRSSHGLNQ